MSFDLLPPLSADEFAALKADIGLHGVRHPVFVDEEDNVLDGRHRLKIDPNAPRQVIAGLSEAEKEAFVFRCNFVRRNLSPEQRAEAHRKMKLTANKLRQEDPKKWTQARIARALGVSQQTVSDWFASNTGAGKASTPCHNGTYGNGNRSENQTMANERPYFTADARLKISREAHEKIFQMVKSGQTQEQVAANIGIGRRRVGQICQRETKRRQAEHGRQLAQKRASSLVGDDLGVKVGDWRQLVNDIPDQSVELIFTDPPYHKEALPHYESLGPAAARILVPGGSLIAYCGVGLLPRVLDALRASEGLRYYWTIGLLLGQKGRMPRSGIITGWKPLLWFIKGSERFDPTRWVEDAISSPLEKSKGRWQQSEKDCELFISSLTGKGGLVFDPMGGTGTTAAAAKRLGRRWLTCEIDQGLAAKIRERLLQ